jgi:cytosine/adenosine deaminase-related metal-dependent hydrolase
VRAGRIDRVLTSAAAVRRAGIPVEDLGECVLLPGFVAAHTHLDLAGFHRRISAGRRFPDWIRALLGARAGAAPAELERATRGAAERMLATGTTCVGDIDATGRLIAASRGLRLRVRRYREVLDAGDAARAQDALRALHSPRRHAALWTEGVSPHAPYTISAELWAAIARHARRHRSHCAIHWAETPEERAWLERGLGPFAGLLVHSPRRSGLDAIESAGLLGPRTALIHGNDATPDERGRIARSGAVLVHCPGTHAFFGRERFDAEAWRAAGVPLALGTDSLASNDDLDMGREMALFRAAQPGFGPEQVLEMATGSAARAVGLAGRVGTLDVGAWADCAALAAPGRDAAERLDAITRGLGRPIAVWVGGMRAGERSSQDSPTSRIGKVPRGAQNDPRRPTS